MMQGNVMKSAAKASSGKLRQGERNQCMSRRGALGGLSQPRDRQTDREHEENKRPGVAKQDPCLKRQDDGRL